jgi:hypothetical protein
MTKYRKRPSPEVKAFRKHGKARCPECKGTGLITLPKHYQEIWDRLNEKQNLWGLSCDNLICMVSDEPTHMAMNNRLEVMMSLGLILRFKMGRCYIWKVWE